MDIPKSEMEIGSDLLTYDFLRRPVTADANRRRLVFEMTNKVVVTAAAKSLFLVTCALGDLARDVLSTRYRARIFKLRAR